MAGITVPISSAMRTRAMAAIAHLWPDASGRPDVTDYTPRELRSIVRGVHQETVGADEAVLVAEGWLMTDGSGTEDDGAGGQRFTAESNANVS